MLFFSFRAHLLAQVDFGFLPAEAKVYIYDVSGALLRVLEESNGDGGVGWDGRNQVGRAVASGIYWFQAVSGVERSRGRFALIRE